LYYWFFIVDFGLGQLVQANAWVKIKIVTAALLRARFNVSDVMQIQRVMKKNTTPVYIGLFCLFWCHANGKISIGSGQSMEEGSKRHSLCHPLQNDRNTFTEKLSPSDSAHFIPHKSLREKKLDRTCPNAQLASHPTKSVSSHDYCRIVS
jgi:hypothetical protein